MDNFLSYRLLNRCDEILGELISCEEKRELLLNLLLLCHSCRQWPERVQAGWGDPLSVSPWKKLIEENESDINHHLHKVISDVSAVTVELWGVWEAMPRLEQVSGQNLKKILLLFDEYLYNAAEDYLSRAIEVFEALFTLQYPQEGEDKQGRFYTPKQISILLSDLLQPKGRNIYDPCCGSAGLLVAMSDHIKAHGGEAQLYGQEINPASWRLANLNLYLRNLSSNLGGAPSYALSEKLYEMPEMDYVVGNPPFNDDSWRDYGQNSLLASRWRYGVPPKNRSSLAWLQHMLSSLKPGGELGMILNTSALVSSNNSERRIRLGLVGDDLLKAVILLPAGLFYCTKVPVAIVILQNGGERAGKGQVLLIDASSLGVKNGKQIQLTAQDIQRILDTYGAYQRGEQPEQRGFCVTVGNSAILERDGILSPREYVVYEKDALPTWQELQELDISLQAELYGLIQQNADVIARICDAGQKT